MAEIDVAAIGALAGFVVFVVGVGVIIIGEVLYG